MKQLVKSALVLGAAMMAFSAIYAGGGGKAKTRLFIDSDGRGAKTKTVTVDDATLVYRTYGNKAGAPLVLLAPLGVAMDDWDPAVIDGLAKNSTVIVFDNKGVGASSGKTPASIAAMAQDAVSFIHALGYSRVDVLGFSMGGFVAQQIVETEPGLVSKLILVGTGPQGAEGLASIGQKLQGAATLSPEEVFLAGFFSPSEHSRQLGKASFDRIKAKKTDRDQPLSKESFGAEFTAVLGWAQLDPAGIEKARSVTIPVLIVAGQFDFFLPVSNAVKLYETLPNARLVLLPDAGHASFFQYPELFVQEAGYFLHN